MTGSETTVEELVLNNPGQRGRFEAESAAGHRATSSSPSSPPIASLSRALSPSTASISSFDRQDQHTFSTKSVTSKKSFSSRFDVSLLVTTSMFYQYTDTIDIITSEPLSRRRTAAVANVITLYLCGALSFRYGCVASPLSHSNHTHALIASVLLQYEEDRLIAAPSPLTISLRSTGGLSPGVHRPPSGLRGLSSQLLRR